MGPPRDRRARLFERLSLEAFQSGLSWSTILRKRDAFRAAFVGFEPDAVAAFGPADAERLVADASIVRNRAAKAETTIANARAVVALRASGEPFPALVWSHRPKPRPVPRGLGDVPAVTSESKALADALRRRGFRFLGPTMSRTASSARTSRRCRVRRPGFSLLVERRRPPGCGLPARLRP